jgi:PTS system ascorbate-specific IIA component
MSSFIQRLMSSDTIATGLEAADWEAAVRFGGGMMIKAGLCEPRYIEAIIDNHRSFGPYFIVAPGIAMPHAKPENGVLKTGYAFVMLSRPVEFGDPDNDPVDMLIFAGAVNREEHNEEVVAQVAELCDSDAYIERLRGADGIAEVKEILLDFDRAFQAGELE